LKASMELSLGMEVPDEDLGLYAEELGLDQWSRGLAWASPPDPARLAAFPVVVIGAGMGGLCAARQLKRAGFPFTIFEKNSGVGGTWHENRYPGARVDSASRSYTNSFAVDYELSHPYCPWEENQRYFDWIADEFGLREHIEFDTEVRSLTWDETAAEWEITVEGPAGSRTVRARAVITAVGFLNRPSIPEIEGMH